MNVGQLAFDSPVWNVAAHGDVDVIRKLVDDSSLGDLRGWWGVGHQMFSRKQKALELYGLCIPFAGNHGMAGERRELMRNSDGEVPSPRNLIHEPWRQELQDPLNLHRLTTRQTIEQHGIVELYERFASAGARTPVRNEPAAVATPSRAGRIRKAQF